MDKDEFRVSFFEECEELLEAMHDGFDQMASQNHDEETMHAIFRAVHSIKGGAGAFGLNDLVGFAHHFETSLDRVRSGKQMLNRDLLELFQQCGDNLADLVSAARASDETPNSRSGVLRTQLDEMLGISSIEVDEEEPDFEPIALELGDLDLPVDHDAIKISFAARPGLFLSGSDPAILFLVLGRTGAVDVKADLSSVPDLDELNPEDCSIRWELSYSGEADRSEILEVFEFVEDDCDLLVEFEEIGDAVKGPEHLELPDTLLPSATEITALMAPEPAEDHDQLSTELLPAKLKDPQSEQKNTIPVDRKLAGGTIRVDLEKIDRLINLVGELVIKEAMLAQSISDLGASSESDISVGFESLKSLAGEIQEGVMSIRAQPVKPMFQRMARIVREAATATGKKVRLVTQGEYTEVDKTVLERLVDPLTHMIRNAVDHGLEDTNGRTSVGKMAEGTVSLSAAHRSGRVMIDVSDDGAGINRERVKAKAIERGLISGSDTLSNSEIDNLLFLAGFSSAEEVSELSGRGVGLDVVRNEIQKLGGRVSIHSDPGEGTTFSISLPLTLAVLEGMVINVAGQTMVVPISAIQETLQPRTAAIQDIGSGGRVVRSRDMLIPIIDVGAFFGFRSEPKDLESHILLLIESDDHLRYGLVVDEIQDQRQVVIKSLETNYHQVDGIAAATILGDGRVALILDPDNIVRGSGARQTGDSNMKMAV